MKNIKRWLSFLMALTLLLSLTVPAYAENDAGAVSTAEAEQTTAPEDPSAQPVADDTTADVVEDGYYLVGTMNNWQPSAAYKFAVNPANDKEYMLTDFTLKIGDEFKAIEVVSGNWTWYPDNSGNYVVYEAQAGIVTIYFQKEYNPAWGGYLFVEKKGDVPPLPQASVETLEPEESVPLYDASGEQTGETASLEAEYKFAAKTPTDEQKAYYGNWCADYRISFDGAVAANSIGLYGEYNGFGKEYKVGFLFPNALEKDETVDLLRLAGPEVTYNDIVDQIQEFTCGVWNTSADNIGKTITVELIIWDPAAPNTTYTVATESYTFEAPPYPEASIETIDPETGVPIFDIDTRTETGETADLEAEYKYTQAKEPTALQLAYYGSWGADFRVSFDRPVAANTVGLYGAYSGWGYDHLKVGFLYPTDLAAGQQVKLLTLADFNVSYNDIVKVIQEFICGVWNTDPANYGTTITVELVIWDPNDATKEHVVATESYTFKGPQIPELPEANVETLKPATVQVDGEDVTLEAEYKFTPKDPTEEQLAYYGNWYADYRVSMDADTAKESFGLYGEYSGYGQEFKQGYLFPQALTANEPVKLLELANLSGVTYNDLVNNIGEFTCGVWNESAENIGKTITVELIIWDPNDANAEPAVISTTKYTFTAPVIPELPEANVETLKPATVQVDGEDVALEAEYKFTPKDPTEEQLAYYGNWYADYRVSMDADTAKESFGLYGEYSGYGQEFKQGYLFPQALTANEPVKLLELANLSGVTYNDLVNNIGAFTCGVWNESAENIGKTITVELIIWDPNDANAEPAVISTTKYTFQKPDLPTAKVETVEEPKTGVPLYDTSYQQTGETADLEAEYIFTPDNPTDLQIAYYGKWHADFRVSFDDDLAANSFGLFGAYNGYGQEFNVGFLFPQDVTKGQPIQLMELAGFTGDTAITYNDLVKNVKVFDCGVFNRSVDNIGKTITVELIIWDPQDPDTVYVVNTTSYTFQGATLELQSQDTQGNTGIAALTGGGVFFKGAEVTVTAGAANGYSFIGWHKDSAAGELVSTDAEYSFKIAEDMKLVAVYQSAGTGELHIIGSKYEVDDSGPQESSADFDKPVGKQVVLTYTGTDFLYWVNISGNIISTSEEYVFTMVGETTIRLVTSRDLESRESVYVVFLNAYDQVLSAQRILDEESAELAFPKTIPSKMGVTFEKWVFEGTDEEATPESIAARIASGNPVVKIVPKYSDPADSYTLTVKVKNGGSLSDVEGYTELVIPAGQPKTIKVSDIAKAAGLEEANFSFWSLDGETADSFNKTEYTVIASKDQNITLVAVFGEAVDEEPTVAITQMYRDYVDNKYKVCVTMRYFVPEGYTVHESGFIFTGNAANVTDPDAYVIGAPGANKHISNMTSNSAIYTANLSTGTNPDKTIYLKAFVIYTDDQGEMHTIYTDLRQGSYNSLQGN